MAVSYRSLLITTKKICDSTNDIVTLGKSRGEICDWALANQQTNLGKAYLSFIDLYANLENTTYLTQELGVSGNTKWKVRRTIRYLYWTILCLRDVLGRLILMRLKEQIRLVQKEKEEEDAHMKRILKEFDQQDEASREHE